MAHTMNKNPSEPDNTAAGRYGAWEKPQLRRISVVGRTEGTGKSPLIAEMDIYASGLS
jgi:hypothetical protein